MKGNWIFPTVAAALLVPALAFAQARPAPQVAAASPAAVGVVKRNIENPLKWVNPQGLDKIRHFAEVRAVPGTIVLQPSGWSGADNVWIKSRGAPTPDGKPNMTIVGYASLHRGDVRDIVFYNPGDPNPKPFKP